MFYSCSLILMMNYQKTLENFTVHLDKTTQSNHFPLHLLTVYRIFDTKFMVSSCPSLQKLMTNGTSLPETYKVCDENEAFKKVKWTFTEDKYKSYDESNENRKFHEAGYDAFVTGQIYIKSL